MVYPTVYEYIPFNSYLAHCSMAMLVITIWYPLVNKQLDPENHQFFMKTSLPTQMTARVYVSHNQRVTIILSLEDDVLHPRGVVSLDLYIRPEKDLPRWGVLPSCQKNGAIKRDTQPTRRVIWWYSGNTWEYHMGIYSISSINADSIGYSWGYFMVIYFMMTIRGSCRSYW